MKDRRAELMAHMLRVKGYLVWTSPTASLEADERARLVSGVEAHFLRKPALASIATAPRNEQGEHPTTLF